MFEWGLVVEFQVSFDGSILSSIQGRSSIQERSSSKPRDFAPLSDSRLNQQANASPIIVSPGAAKKVFFRLHAAAANDEVRRSSSVFPSGGAALDESTSEAKKHATNLAEELTKGCEECVRIMLTGHSIYSFLCFVVPGVHARNHACV